MHQDCARDYGKTLVTKGNATRDAHCRCLWEEGYAPQDMDEECTSPLGFHRDTNCYCQPYGGCSENQRLNKGNVTHARARTYIHKHFLFLLSTLYNTFTERMRSELNCKKIT